MDRQLTAFLHEQFATPYKPGQWDCVLFVAAWADLRTGSEHLRHLRGTYATHLQGLRNLAPHGIGEAVTRHLLACGWQRVEIADMQPGDIVITNLDHPGIWSGESIASAARGAAGYTILHPRHALFSLRPPTRP